MQFCISLFIFGDNLHFKATLMGVTIHYRGKLKSPDLVSRLTHEVEEICISNNWSYQLLNDKTSGGSSMSPTNPFLMGEMEEFDPEFGWGTEDFGAGLRGITFEPHEESETITFLFDEEGILRTMMSNFFGSKSKYPWCFAKTQFAGIETHIRIINLMTYLKKKYFKRLDIHDDGGYYPDENREVLQNRMDHLNSTIATVHDVFENMDIDGSKNPEDVINDIREALSASLKGVKIQVIRVDPLSMMSDMFKSLEAAKEKIRAQIAPSEEQTEKEPKEKKSKKKKEKAEKKERKGKKDKKEKKKKKDKKDENELPF